MIRTPTRGHGRRTVTAWGLVPPLVACVVAVAACGDGERSDQPAPRASTRATTPAPTGENHAAGEPSPSPQAATPTATDGSTGGGSTGGGSTPEANPGGASADAAETGGTPAGEAEAGGAGAAPDDASATPPGTSEEPIRQPARFTVGARDVRPASVTVAPFLAVALEVVNDDAAAHRIRLVGTDVAFAVPPGRTERRLLPGLRAGMYTLSVDAGATAASLVVGDEAGP